MMRRPVRTDRPDGGVAEIVGQFSHPPAVLGAPPGMSADLAAGLTVRVGQLADALTAEHRRRAELSAAIYPFEIPVTSLAASGTLDQPVHFGPRDGYAWDLRRLTAASFTAGTVAVYRNQAADANQLFTFTSAGTWWIASGQVILRSTERLVLVAAGITGSVTVSGSAIMVAEPWLAEYLL